MSRQPISPRAKLILLHLFLIGAMAGGLSLMSRIFGGVCPMRMIFHIPCPFCGMTRAHLALLRLDFRGAFAEHPLFLFGLPYLFLLFHPTIFHGKWVKIRKIAIASLTFLFILTYFFRLFDL